MSADDKTFTETEFMILCLAVFPDAEIGEDNDGQIVIYTNMHDVDGRIVPMGAP